MAGTSYLPSRQEELSSYCAALAGKLVADPTGFGLDVDQAGKYQVLQVAYSDALAVALDSETRSPANIVKKNTARDVLIAETRKLVDIMQAWPGMTNDKRSELNITLRDNIPTPAPIPASAPEVNVTSVSGRLFNIELRQVGSDKRAKPARVHAAWIYTAFGDEQPTTFDTFMFRGEARKTDTQIVMPESVAPGTKVWVSACWVNTAGKPGPASLPIATWTTHGSMNVAA